MLLDLEEAAWSSGTGQGPDPLLVCIGFSGTKLDGTSRLSGPLGKEDLDSVPGTGLLCVWPCTVKVKRAAALGLTWPGFKYLPCYRL